MKKMKKMQKMKKKKTLLFICALREFSGPFPQRRQTMMTHWMEERGREKREGEKRGEEEKESNGRDEDAEGKL